MATEKTASPKGMTSSSSSLHESVRAEISKRIENGFYKPGDAIASTAQMSEELGVSAITVKRAVRDLQSAGVLESVPGKGTFVKEKRRFIRELDVWMSSMDNARRLGFEPRMELVSITKERIADPTLALFGPPDNVYLCVRKIIYADGQPIMYDAAYVPTSVPDEIVDEFGEHFIVTALNRHDVAVKDMSLVIDAAPASSGAQKIFAIPNTYPMLRRLYHISTETPGIDVFGVVESPFDRLACSINLSKEAISRMEKK
ncbi:GntR family transcriptional regulator [Paraburkholderia sp. JPY465]|uniref:GntR family transcriptional regulator n=1 Tax=Paraburkholderia sp. JPY465 TaxID=3042285 RepID=UPI003D200471